MKKLFFLLSITIALTGYIYSFHEFDIKISADDDLIELHNDKEII